jgi:hypothetical protein
MSFSFFALIHHFGFPYEVTLQRLAVFTSLRVGEPKEKNQCLTFCALKNTKTVAKVQEIETK